MEIEHLIRYLPLAVGLMEIENLFRYTALAVGLKPSANQGKARLRGLYRIIYSKTISPRLCRRSPPARAIPNDLFKDHKRWTESTTGAAAPVLARADALRQPRASGASCAQRGRSRLRGRCAP
jgi:hypothetical protein